MAPPNQSRCNPPATRRQPERQEKKALALLTLYQMSTGLDHGAMTRHESPMRSCIILALAAVVLLGCSSNAKKTPIEEAPGEVAQSSKPRITSPDVSNEELQTLSADNADFAWAFYREIIKPGENLFFSPHSLSVALAMTWAGAEGATADQMADDVDCGF